ncbi:hypothetical protein [Deinococcus hohokamensis]|uniref:Uncharacterized protein n=1 Tax=Deinococcus hohokamensis TaxID=309883 RepID=A0ABV9I4L9_9DEIO
MDWKATLADLRAHLPPARGPGPVRGSLRWLEAEMRARGANPASLRNIVYRDVGTSADKAALAAILEVLAREAGRPLVAQPAPPSAPLPDELELLGRSKKRAYKQFLAGVRAGRAPRLIVTGRAGAGKTILLGQVERALAELRVPVRRLALTGEAGTALGFSPGGQSFAALGQAQTDAARRALPPAGALLVRVTNDLRFAGGPPRDAAGRSISAARWAQEHLLRHAPAGVAVLLAVEDPIGLDQADPAAGELIELRPPTPAEARTYLMGRLGITRAEADRLVAETGRHLDRLALLGTLGQDSSGRASGAADLMADRDARALAEATAALQALVPGRALEDALLAAALGTPVSALPAHARALLRGDASEGWRPSAALQAAWPQVSPAARAAALRHVAGAEATLDAGPRFAALAALGDWAALAAQVTRHPDDARHLPALWPAVRQSAQGPERETLARAVVGHHAGRGEYSHPRLRDGLFTLLESERDVVRAWARVKLAESSLEGGNIEAAQAQLAHSDVAELLAGATLPDAWAQAAQTDALLVEAALARWQGDLDRATARASDPRAVHGGPRALLWRGLIAKDAGRWPEALGALRAVPASSPLLSGRARYQEGDLLLRLGVPAAGLAALDDAVRRLEEAGAGDEEQARVLARSGTALRRLGRAREGLTRLEQALARLPNEWPRPGEAISRARLLSEMVPAHLALGQPEEALRAAGEALALLADADGRQAEAGYRQRRTLLRVALAYLSRGLGRPYQQPLSGAHADNADLAHARNLIDTLLRGAEPGSDRDHILRLDLYLSRALAEPRPLRAVQDAGHALALARHPYEEAQARAVHAEALLRAGQPDAALSEINRAHALLRRVVSGLPLGPEASPQADPALQAQLLALEARACILDGVQTLRWLRDALRPEAVAPFRAGVWREVGAALEAIHPEPQATLEALHSGLALSVLRLPDALAQAELGRAGLPDR